jgi:uncharacterized protein YjdB
MKRTLLLGLLLAGAALPVLAPGPAVAARPELVGITVLPASASLVPGQTMAVRAIGHYADDSTADITSKVVFKDDSAVARIFKNLITARDPGTVEIRAVTRSGNFTSDQNLTLTVSPIVALELDPESDGIRLGDSIQWTARATLASGATRVPVTALMDWSSSDTNVVHIGARNKIKGLAKARGLGTATIEARDPESGATATLELVVVTELASIAVEPEARFLQLDESTRFRVIGTFEGGHEAEISSSARWVSANEAIARIDKSGVVTPLALGVVELSAFDKTTGISSDDSGQNGVLTVVGDLLSIAVDPAELELGVGETERLRALGTYEGAAGSFRMGGRVDWFTSDPDVATVDGDGDVACLAAGTATLSARDEETGITSTATGGDGEVTCVEL